jgi:alginate O-acetyltransferase complex protein AlgI
MLLERVGLKDILERLPRIVQHAYLMLIITISWVFFRAQDIGGAVDYIGAMFGANSLESGQMALANFTTPYMLTVFAVGLILAVNPLKFARYRRMKHHLINSVRLSPHAVGYLFSGGQLVIYAILLALSIAAVATQTHQAFIYFRF